MPTPPANKNKTLFLKRYTIISKIITSKFLKQHHARKEVIEFFENNFPESLFPEGLNLSKIEVTGDYGGYFQWINRLLECTFEYDSFGNMVKRTFPSGTIKEYDSEGNKFKRIYPKGIIEEYDSFGNMIKKTYSSGDIFEYEYNSKRDLIKRTSPSGKIEEYKYEYNDKGNLIKITYPKGIIEEYKYEYDSLGRLIQINDCRIKYLN